MDQVQFITNKGHGASNRVSSQNEGGVGLFLIPSIHTVQATSLNSFILPRKIKARALMFTDGHARRAHASRLLSDYRRNKKRRSSSHRFLPLPWTPRVRTPRFSEFILRASLPRYKKVVNCPYCSYILLSLFHFEQRSCHQLLSSMGGQGHVPQLLGQISGIVMPFDGTEDHLLPDTQSSRPRTSKQYSYLGDGDISPKGLSVHFMASCSTNEPEVNDHQQRLSPSSSQSVGYPESSQRTTSAFQTSAQYDLQNFDYFASSTFLSSQVSRTSLRASHILPSCKEWVGDQDDEQINPTSIQLLDYPGSQSPTGQDQVSPDSASAEYTYPDDSDMETGLVMSQMMAHFQIHTPPPNAGMTMSVTDMDPAIPSVMTFRLGRQSLRPVADPDNARILESFDDPDEDASGESCESSSPPSPPYLPPSSFYDGPAAGGYGNVIERNSVIGVASSKEGCSSYLPDEIPHFGGPIDSFIPLNTAPRRRGSSKRSKMHQCSICLKIFPRPSGLNTHMNSHSGAKRAL